VESSRHADNGPTPTAAIPKIASCCEKLNPVIYDCYYGASACLKDQGGYMSISLIVEHRFFSAAAPCDAAVLQLLFLMMTLMTSLDRVVT